MNKKARKLMEEIDHLREVANALINSRRENHAKFGPNSDMAEAIQTQVTVTEDEIDRLLRIYWEVKDEPEEDDRDVDVLEDSVRLIREHLTSVGIDVPFIDDCAAVAAHHIKELRSSVAKLAIKTFETTEERDHRPYKVKKTVCRLCKASVNVATQAPGYAWQQTGVKLSHAKDCVMNIVEEK